MTFSTLRTRHSLRDIYSRFQRDEDGFTAVEFAMVLGPFLTLMFAILEVAFVFFGTFSFENGVEQIARQIRTGQAHASGFDVNGTSYAKSADGFKSAICARMPSFGDCVNNMRVDVRAYPSFDAMATAAAAMKDPTNADSVYNNDGTLKANFEAFNIGEGSDVVMVTAYYEWNLMASFPKIGIGLGNQPNGNRLFAVSTAFRNEPFSE